jgi:hypothetical protein
MQIFHPLSNKLALTLNATQTVRIFPKLSFDSGVNFDQEYCFLVEKKHNYSLLIVHPELKMLDDMVFQNYFLLISQSKKFI